MYFSVAECDVNQKDFFMIKRNSVSIKKVQQAKKVYVTRANSQ